jgi:hypothetical protein
LTGLTKDIRLDVVAVTKEYRALYGPDTVSWYDRMGQKSDKIIIGNLCIENTIDVVINRILLSRIAAATDLVGEMEPIIAQGLAKINELIITKEFTEAELLKREKEIEQRIEKAKQTREEFDEARYELVNDKGFRDEFEADIKKSRVSPRESLLFTYSFLKKENGCSLKIISETSGIIHVSKDICERIRSYIKRMNLGKRGEELQALVNSGGDLLIDFDGDAAYANKEAVFFKPAGAWIHFAIDYLRALNTENYEDLFYATIKEKDVDELEKGRFWIFSYEMEFDGFFDARSYEYIICQEDEVVESWKRFFNRGTNWKDFPQVTSYEEYRKITDKQHLSKVKSMPIKFLKTSGKGFFIDKDGYALGIRDELADVIKVDAFKKQMKDIIEYRTMEYYRRRYVEK